MFTDVQIANLGLSKIGEARIQRIDPPRTSLERHIAEGYTHWKRTELTKNRWVFAAENQAQLARVSDEAPEAFKYQFELPTDCLRPIRRKFDLWKQRGRFLYAPSETLTISYVRDVPESDFDPLFVEVLAARIAVESVEYSTQSNTKSDRIELKYDSAVDDAARANAFITGPIDNTSDDDAYAFVRARHYGYEFDINYNDDYGGTDNY